MNDWPAILYDGETSRRIPVRLRRVDDLLVITTPDSERQVSLAELQLAPRIPGLPLQLRLPDGPVCELEPQAELDTLLGDLPGYRRAGLVAALESHWRYILPALALALLVLFGVVRYGIPLLAEQVAARLPPALESHMGDQALEVFDRWMVGPSQLPEARQAELRAEFARLAETSGAPAVTVLFRDGRGVGANAFALPGGTILFTDQMVGLAEDDTELLGVFAHELGHVVHHHALRLLLQDSATALLLILLTGDVGSASSLAAGLPTLLVRTRFSRDFEREADDHARRLMETAGMDPAHLANLLERMVGPEDAALPGFLSTHPTTAERLARLREGAQPRAR